MISETVTLLKFISTLAAGVFGLDAVYGGTTDKKGNLTRRGHRARLGVAVSVSVALLMLSLETCQSAAKAREEARVRARSDSALADILRGAQSLSDSLAQLGSISRSVLGEQRAVGLDAARLLYPLSGRIMAGGGWRYALSQAPLDEFASRLRTMSQALFSEWGDVLRDSTRRNPSAGFFILSRAARRQGPIFLIEGDTIGPTDEPRYVTFDVERRVLSIDGSVHIYGPSVATMSRESPVDSVRLSSGRHAFGSLLDSYDLHRMRLELGLNRDRGGVYGKSSDLGWNVAIGEDAEESVNPIPGESRLYLYIDYAAGTLDVLFRTDRVQNVETSGRISSILDLPGSTLELHVPGVFGSNAEIRAFPICSYGVWLALDGGHGRVIRSRPHRFSVVRHEGRAYEGILRHRYTVGDIEVRPGELARFFPVADYPRSAADLTASASMNLAGLNCSQP